MMPCGSGPYSLSAVPFRNNTYSQSQHWQFRFPSSQPIKEEAELLQNLFPVPSRVVEQS